MIGGFGRVPINWHTRAIGGFGLSSRVADSARRDAVPRGGRDHVEKPSKRGAIVEARRESRPRRGGHINAQAKSERGSEQGGILVGRCRDLRRPVL